MPVSDSMVVATIAPSSVSATHRVPMFASFLAFGAGVIWSLGSLTARLAKHADAWQYLIWRSVGVLVVMEVASKIRGKGWVTPRAFNQGWIMFLGTFGLMMSSLTFVYAIKNTTAANAAFLASVTPLFAVVLSRIFLGERLTRITIGAMFMALCGLTLMVATDVSGGNMVGNVSALLSSLGFAIYTVCVRSEPHRDWSPILPGYASMMIVLCGVVTVAQGHTLTPPTHDITLGLVHGGLLIVVGTLLFNYGSRSVPAVAMTILAQSEMAFVPFWIYLWFGEAPKPWALVGGLIILTAIIGKAVLEAAPAQHESSLLTTVDGETRDADPGFIA
ncbi:MAG: EamA-like transporter family protein [Ilumatobacteraceae bacterium]|nr:EamA-like transporter family protein [Ilumatobacteraceae bacterium]